MGLGGVNRNFSRLHRGLHVIADRESCVPENEMYIVFMYKLGGNADLTSPYIRGGVFLFAPISNRNQCLIIII